MLEKLLNINGLQKLNKSEHPGYEYGGSACIQGFCHFF